MSEKIAQNVALIENFTKKLSGRSKILLSEKPSPIMGWFSTYVPEEIIYAAGFLPYRIMGEPVALGRAKACLQGNLNPFVQSTLECALEGKYTFIDGIIIGNADDATRRLYDAWKIYVKTPFTYLLDIPKNNNEESIERFTVELSYLKKAIEKHFRINISNDSIRQAINMLNATRKLLQSLNNLRKNDTLPITSNQFLEIVTLSVAADKDFFNQQLGLLLTQINISIDMPKVDKPRILITGSFQNQPWLSQLIEDAGGIVVCEDLCTRIRYFQELVDTSIEDPIHALSKRYLNKPPGARMVDLNRRFRYINSLIDDFRIDGVVYYALKFDDPYLFEFPALLEMLQKRKTPIIFIESDHRQGAIGQIKTRVQAFLEILNLKVPIL